MVGSMCTWMQRSGKDSRFLCCWLYLSVSFIAFHQSYKQALRCVEQLENVDKNGERRRRRKKNGHNLQKSRLIISQNDRCMRMDCDAIFRQYFPFTWHLICTAHCTIQIELQELNALLVKSIHTDLPSDQTMWSSFFSHFKNGYKSSLFHLNWKADTGWECTCECVWCFYSALFFLLIFLSNNSKVACKTTQKHADKHIPVVYSPMDLFRSLKYWFLCRAMRTKCSTSSSKSSKNNAYCNVAHWHTLAQVFG